MQVYTYFINDQLTQIKIRAIWTKNSLFGDKILSIKYSMEYMKLSCERIECV